MRYGYPDVPQLSTTIGRGWQGVGPPPGPLPRRGSNSGARAKGAKGANPCNCAARKGAKASFDFAQDRQRMAKNRGCRGDADGRGMGHDKEISCGGDISKKDIQSSSKVLDFGLRLRSASRI